MFDEISALAVLMVPMFPFSGSTLDDIKRAETPSAIYRNFEQDGGNISLSEIFCQNSSFILENLPAIPQLNHVANSSRYFSQNHRMMNMYEADLERAIEKLKSYITENVVEYGEEVADWGFFESFRHQKIYEDILRSFSSSDRYAASLLILLSQVGYNETFAWEREFVIEQLCSNSLRAQEFALNTISLWNSRELLPKINSIKIKNKFLQKRLTVLKNRFEK